ncbi:MAG: AAA family ATPase [Clostridia bacterium]|nr:AAA family ATPase [Clostridia bacterium]
MFEMPYDKKTVLRQEIKTFFEKLLDIEINKHSFIYVDKHKADERFPKFHKIQDFVCSADKTEKFLERLNTSIDKIKTHLHTPFQAEYNIEYQPLTKKVDTFNTVLNKALPLVNIEIKQPPKGFYAPSATLLYKEIPDEKLLSIVDELIDKLLLLVEKIKNFIKKNNAFGSPNRQKPNKLYKIPDKFNEIDELQKRLEDVEKILDKKYVVDIFSDGDIELKEMQLSLWNALYVLMQVNVLKSEYFFKVEEQSFNGEDSFFSQIKQIVDENYLEIKTAVNATSFLCDIAEESLFEIYNNIINLDEFNFLGLAGANLIQIGESEKKLNELIGLANIKDSIKKIKAYALANKDAYVLNLHMCFYGNPGTGKTEVARIIAGILYENKILPTKNVVEVDRSGLVSQYLGETPIKTMQAIEEAMGGVLFIDEAYSLVPKDAGFDYGNEAVATLIKAMEDYRGKFCVILAGYKNQMENMIATNPGFESRIQFKLDFPNYSRPELKEITQLMINKRQYTISDTALEKILDITDVKRKEPNFANAREIRNILDQVIMCQNVRVAGHQDTEIGLIDVHKYIEDAKIVLPTSGEGLALKILTAEEELDNLIGLQGIKRTVKKIKAYAKRNKDDYNFNLHMCFYGNPGTGKTEVARIISRILYEAGILSEAKLIETDAHGLIGKYVGETAPKTEAKIQEALGGVLFIDEAYALADTRGANGTSVGYGEEAISALLKKMEDLRGKFVVVFAGYYNEMKEMLAYNPGMESRIQFSLEFPDYTRDELCEITKLFAQKRKYSLTEDAMIRFLDVVEYYRNEPNFANARTVRNVLDQVIMNQNLRTEDDLSEIIILQDVEDYIADEKIDFSHNSLKKKIGF